MKKKKKAIKKEKKDFAIIFTNWVGSKNSLLVHTFFFIGSFVLVLFGIDLEKVLLVLTTVVSLEAIYLAIFIQMTVNRNTESLASVEKDIDEIQEDIDEIQEDVEEIQEDVEEIQEDVEGIEKDIDEIEKDIDEIQEDVEEIQEEEDEEEFDFDKTVEYFGKMEKQLQELMKEVSTLKKLKK
ncbi:MAG: hypothetical protein PHS92_02560 [Candidatus Gracilibacteria bacterium]|nr:hypothetical protein [Candidatus Gracilibacteria bacterium]